MIIQGRFDAQTKKHLLISNNNESGINRCIISFENVTGNTAIIQFGDESSGSIPITNGIVKWETTNLIYGKTGNFSVSLNGESMNMFSIPEILSNTDNVMLVYEENLYVLKKVPESSADKVNYIVEEYDWTYGTYRKWSNGFGEIWLKYTTKITNYSTVGNFYGYVLSLALPFTFKSIPTKVYNLQIGSGFGMPGTGTMGDTTTKVQFYGLGTASGTQSITVSAYVWGKWK